jgi:hypothetical protein
VQGRRKEGKAQQQVCTLVVLGGGETTHTQKIKKIENDII